MVVRFTTTYAISAYHLSRCTTLCDKVCQWLAIGRWFSPGPLVSSTNKTNRHDITEILLKVALKHHQTNKQTLYCNQTYSRCNFSSKIRPCEDTFMNTTGISFWKCLSHELKNVYLWYFVPAISWREQVNCDDGMRWWWGPLCTRPARLVWFFIVLDHWNNSPWIYMLHHSDTLSWFRANQYLLFIPIL